MKYGTSMLMIYSVLYNARRIFCNTVLKTVKMHILARLRDKWPRSYYTASVYCSITESFKKKRQSHFVGDPLSHWKVALLTHKVRATATPAYLSDLIQTHVPIRSLRSSWLGHHAAYRIPKTIVIVWFITVIQKEKGDWGGGVLRHTVETYKRTDTAVCSLLAQLPSISIIASMHTKRGYIGPSREHGRQARPSSITYKTHGADDKHANLGIIPVGELPSAVIDRVDICTVNARWLYPYTSQIHVQTIIHVDTAT